MSDIAKSLLHYAAHSRREGCADDSDWEFCWRAARTYAAYILAAGVAR